MVSLQPVRRLPQAHRANEAIDMAVLGRFLTEVVQRSERGSVRIRTSVRGRAWRVTVLDPRLDAVSASASTLGLALERALQRLIAPRN